MKYLNLIKHVANWQDYLGIKLGFNKDKPVILKLGEIPLKLKLIPSMKPLFNEIFLKDVYGPALKSVKTETPTIIDIGGNMGFFAMYSFLNKPKAKIYSFEPVPTNFSFLNNHKKEHSFLNWELYNVAVSDKSGEFDFYYNHNYSPEGVDVSASLFSSDKISTVENSHNKITVPVVSFLDWMKENNIKGCDILKLDCEGAEYNIAYSLPDELFKNIKYIVADVHPMTGKNENIQALSSFLKTKGYKVDVVNEELLYAQYAS